jgi:hypothetical protein
MVWDPLCHKIVIQYKNYYIKLRKIIKFGVILASGCEVHTVKLYVGNATLKCQVYVHNY